jgi:ParB-like chromosome segregation protein Spo0J
MAAKTLGMKKVPTLRIEHLTPDQVKAYRIADNQLAANADWDIDLLKMEMEGLTGQGFDIDIIGFHASELNFDKIDYSILDDDTAIDEAMDAMKEGVKKAIQIEFEAEHYEEAVELVKWWRDKKAYIGYMFMTFLKKEKQKV